jgi:hypothetical protein
MADSDKDEDQTHIIETPFAKIEVPKGAEMRKPESPTQEPESSNKEAP